MENPNILETPAVEVQTQQPVEQAPSTQQAAPEDLISRVSKFVESNDPKKQPQVNIEGDFDLKEIEAIKDPIAKDQAMKAYKSFQKGFNHKFQEIADLRKELQAIKQGNQQQLTQQWTPQRIQELMNDPNFVQAAKQVAGVDEVGSDEYVPESVKNKLKELDQIKEQFNVMQQKTSIAARQQEHKQLSDRYGNYNPQKIDEITKEMLEGKVQATNEHIYKAFFHDDNVKRAYEMGRKDEREGIGDKQAASSFEGSSNGVAPVQTIKAEKTESDKAFWGRIVQNTLSKVKK